MVQFLGGITVQSFIFSKLFTKKGSENLEIYLNCQLVCHHFYNLFNDPFLFRQALKRSERNYSLEKLEDNAEQEAFKTRSLFTTLSRARQLESQERNQEAIEILFNALTASNSRLLTYETALLLDQDLDRFLPKDTSKQLIAEKIKSTILSLSDDLNTGPSTEQSLKHCAILRLYLLYRLYAGQYPNIFNQSSLEEELRFEKIANQIKDAHAATTSGRTNKELAQAIQIPAEICTFIALNDYTLSQIHRARLLNIAAFKGDTNAYFSLAKAYERGFCGVRDYQRSYIPLGINLHKSVFLLTELAKKNDVKAKLELGRLFRFGDQNRFSRVPFPPYLTKSIEWYTEAFEQGSSIAAFYLAEIYESGGEDIPQDLPMAVTFYNLATDKVADAAFKLSKIYESGGEGVLQNPQVSLDFLKHAAKMGHKIAQFDLGLRFKQGEGVVKNPKKALKWLQKPDLQRYDDALYEVGLCYESGEGVPQDLSKALTYFKKSIKESEQGTHEKASEKLLYYSHCYQSGDGVPQDPRKAFELLKDAAWGGHSEAQYELGQDLESLAHIAKGYSYQDQSDKIVKMLNKSIKWYEKAADQEHEGAILRLESLNNVQNDHEGNFVNFLQIS